MTTEDIVLILLEVGTRGGLRTEATRDYLSRGLQRFPLDAPVQDVEGWLKEMKPQAPHLFTVPGKPAAGSGSPIAPEHQGLSPAERSTRYRRPAPKRSRPQPVALDAKQAAELAGLPPTQRLTRYRDLQGQRG